MKYIMKKIMKIVLFIVYGLSHCSCHHINIVQNNKLGKSLFQYSSVEDYCSKRIEGNCGDNLWIKLTFLNNPYNLNDNNIVSIYVNNNLVYRDIFKNSIDLKGNPDVLFKNDKRMIFKMEILTDKTKKTIWAHRFTSKIIFTWKKEYHIVYCGFLPTNEDVEKIFFIPQF